MRNWSTFALQKARIFHFSNLSTTMATKMSRVLCAYTTLYISLMLCSTSLLGQWSFDVLSEAKGGVAVAKMDTRLLFVGGIRGNGGPGSSKVEYFESQDNSWSVDNFSFYSAGGFSSATTGPWAIFTNGAYTLVGKVFIYNNDSLKWVTKDNPYHRSGYALTAYDKKAYFAGGGTSKVDVYNFETGEWSSNDTLSQARSDIRTAIVDHKIYFIGGTVNISLNKLSNVIDVYDTKNNSWSTLSLSQARKGAAVAVVGKKIVVAGGQPSNSLFPSSFSRKVDVIDTESGTVSSVEDLSVPNSNMQSAVVGNKVVFVGGETNVAEVLDVETGTLDTFTLPSSDPSLRFVRTASLGKKAFFIGGSVLDGSTVFIYDAESSVWSTDTLPEPQIEAAVMAVGNKIVIVGGRTGVASPYFTDQVSIYTDQSIVNLHDPVISCNTCLSVFPNPSKGLFSFGLDSAKIGASDNVPRVTVTDFLGNVVYSGTPANNQIDISSCASGVYQLIINQSKNTYTTTIIKN